MTYIKKEIQILADSDSGINPSADGSEFTMQIQEGLAIPAFAEQVTVYMMSGSFWYVFPNITTGVNDKMYISYDDGINPINNYVLTIPQGIYTMSALNNAISLQLTNAGSDPLILLTGDDATQRSVIKFLKHTVSIDLSVVRTDTFRDLLGFSPQILTSTFENESVYSDNIADFGELTSIEFHTDLISQGMSKNGRYTNLLYSVPIETKVGRNQAVEPFNPIGFSEQALAGGGRTYFKFWLTGDSRPVNTLGENWNCRLKITYLAKV
jgi:hypothetical protein